MQSCPCKRRSRWIDTTSWFSRWTLLWQSFYWCFRRFVQRESKDVQGAVQWCKRCTSLSSDLQRSLHSAGHRSWRIRQPAPQSKPRELRQRARATCFVPVMAINKADFLAGNKNSQDWDNLWCRKLKQPVFYVDPMKTQWNRKKPPEIPMAFICWMSWSEISQRVRVSWIREP